MGTPMTALDARFSEPGASPTSWEDTEGGEALVFSVALSKVLAFGKGTFTHTRHRF